MQPLRLVVCQLFTTTLLPFPHKSLCTHALVRAVAGAGGVMPDVPPAEEAPCFGDPHLLGRMLDNLPVNAINHTPTGRHVRATLGSRKRGAHVDVSGRGDDASTDVLVVEDTGCGVAADAPPRLFERSYRADPARTRDPAPASYGSGSSTASAERPGRAGLGLAIARWIAEVHGRDAMLAWSHAHASRFDVVLPRSDIAR